MRLTFRALRRLGIRIPVVRLVVTFVYLQPNYKRSLELLFLNGYWPSPTFVSKGPVLLMAIYTNYIKVSFLIGIRSYKVLQLTVFVIFLLQQGVPLTRFSQHFRCYVLSPHARTHHRFYIQLPVIYHRVWLISIYHHE